MSCHKLCTLHCEAPLEKRDAQCRLGNQSDGCLTDPEPDMEMRQAHFRNMRSKCRCSCVLQFTLYRGVSSVLHRPPSQMIHCIVLCFQILRLTSRDCVKRGTETMFGDALPNRGGEITNPCRGESSLNHLRHPRTLARMEKWVWYLNSHGPS